MTNAKRYPNRIHVMLSRAKPLSTLSTSDPAQADGIHMFTRTCGCTGRKDAITTVSFLVNGDIMGQSAE